MYGGIGSSILVNDAQLYSDPLHISFGKLSQDLILFAKGRVDHEATVQRILLGEYLTDCE
jgi:hypothetical protein